jgi:hypothetical protein
LIARLFEKLFSFWVVVSTDLFIFCRYLDLCIKNEHIDV